MVPLVNCEMLQEVFFKLKVVATEATLIILWPMYTIFMCLQIGCWSKIPITYRTLPFGLMQMLILVMENSPIVGTETFWTFRTNFTINWNGHLSAFFSLNVNTMCICSHVLKNLKCLSLQFHNFCQFKRINSSCGPSGCRGSTGPSLCCCRSTWSKSCNSHGDYVWPITW